MNSINTPPARNNILTMKKAPLASLQFELLLYDKKDPNMNKAIHSFKHRYEDNHKETKFSRF